MLELIVLAQETVAERTFEDPATMIPDSSFTLHTDCVLKWAYTGMRLYTFATVTNKCLAMITNSTNHCQPCREITRMSDQAISCFEHTFDFSTAGTYWQPNFYPIKKNYTMKKAKNFFETNILIYLSYL